MENPTKKVKLLNVALVLLCILDLVVAYKINAISDSFWGWTNNSLTNEKDLGLIDILSVAQILLFALSVDAFFRRSCLLFNLRSTTSQIPKIIIEIGSIVIYGLWGFAGFILLYDHSLKILFAASGAIGIGVAYALKDWLAESVACVEIQFDKLFGIGDWIELSDNGTQHHYKILEMDHRMVKVVDYNLKEKLIPNNKFIGGHLVNLSRQKRNHRRKVGISIDAKYPPDRILPLLELAVQHASRHHLDIDDFSNCYVSGIAIGQINYLIKYEANPVISLDRSNSLILQSVYRLLNAACIDLESSLNVKRLNNHKDELVQRLNDIRGYGILQVLSADEIQTLSHSILLRNCDKDDLIVQYGATGESMYLIAEGKFEVSVPNKEGTLEVVANLWPGDCIGEMSLLTGANRSANVLALSKGVLLEITKENLSPLLHANPKLVESLSRLMAERASQNQEHAQRSRTRDQKETRQKLADKITAFFGFAKKII
jgi:CRP-like cAMP-binding protein/small-conductance mechanosensitive channel